MNRPHQVRLIDALTLWVERAGRLRDTANWLIRLIRYDMHRLLNDHEINNHEFADMLFLMSKYKNIDIIIYNC